MRFRPRVMVQAGDPRPRTGVVDRECAPIGMRLAPLEWRQCGRWWSPSWEMWCEGDQLATFETVGVFRHRAVVQTGTARWELRRRGLRWAQQITRAGESEPVVSYRAGWLRTGSILRANAETLRWKSGWFMRHAVIEDVQGFELVSVRMSHAFLRFEGVVQLTEAGRRLPDAEPLALLAWWLLLDAPRHHAH